MSTKLCNKPG